MGAEFLVAILWGVVVVYWLWSRRPALGDSIGLFHHELHALATATPTRVPPANRRRPLPHPANVVGSPVVYSVSEPVFAAGAPMPPSGPAPMPAALAAAALSVKRLETRRRRRDILSVLLVAVLVSVAAAIVTRSVAALSVQALSDLALGAYAYLLVTKTKATMSKSVGPKAQLTARVEQGTAQVEQLTAGVEQLTARVEQGTAVRAEPEEGWLVDLVGLDQSAPSYKPAHALRTTPRATSGHRGTPGARRGTGGTERLSEAYGDFDSYASLALAQAN
jgi:hypothetical protein